jgi:hypothetical protein
MAITSQMVYARVVTQMMEAQQGALAAAERAEQAEKQAG